MHARKNVSSNLVQESKVFTESFSMLLDFKCGWIILKLFSSICSSELLKLRIAAIKVRPLSSYKIQFESRLSTRASLWQAGDGDLWNEKFAGSHSTKPKKLHA